MSIAHRLAPFGVTIFSEMTALALEYGAINLGQGFPNWDGAGFVKAAAAASLSEGGCMTSTHRAPECPSCARSQSPAVTAPCWGGTSSPDDEVTVTCGCTEALAASILGLVNPGDEVILIEPSYDSYPVCLSMAGAVPRFVTLRPPDFPVSTSTCCRQRSLPRRRRRSWSTTRTIQRGRVLSARGAPGSIASLCQEFELPSPSPTRCTKRWSIDVPIPHPVGRAPRECGNGP